tara:strand:+ start:734 stop:1960 length:1227 start_codon:yes stop_codon:yes gene_type:complete
MNTKNNKVFPVEKSIKGLKKYCLNAGIKKKSKFDVGLVVFEKVAHAAIALTNSKTFAPNIKWLKKIKKFGKARALFVNSGNANSYTGETGYKNVITLVDFFSRKLNCPKNQIIISSTGVIGEQLPIKNIILNLENFFKNKKKIESEWKSFASSIKTTDTFIKGSYITTAIGEQKIRIYGVSKGSGMIAPNMATMLAFIFTDATIPIQILKLSLREVLNSSFNNITVDGDTSTNDMVCIFSTNQVKCRKISSFKSFKNSRFFKDLEKLCIDLAKKIVIDGEGAKKLIEINVCGASSKKDAKSIASSVANSPLVKTAIAGEDANWGRIIMAIGNAKAKIKQEKISLALDKYKIIKKGEIVSKINEKNLSNYLKSDNIVINIEIGLGKSKARLWTCDLTKEYISINADYRS